MKRRKRNAAAALWAALCLLLCACGGDGAGGPLPEREAVEKVLVGSSGDVYAGTTGEEQEALLDALYGADLSGFTDTQASDVMGMSVSLKLRAGEEEFLVDILFGQDAAQYLRVRSGENQTFQQGPADAFPYEELNGLVRDVLSSTEDPEHSGRVSVAQAGFQDSVNKGSTAYVRSLLDEALSQSAGEDGADAACDIVLEIGDVSYGISSDTGDIFRQEADQKTFGQLDDRQLMEVKTRLGVLGVTQ